MSPISHQALEYLTELGIRAHLYEDTLLVDRTSMCEFQPVSGYEHASYTAVLNGLRTEFPAYLIYWAGRTDEWLGVEFMLKSSADATYSYYEVGMLCRPEYDAAPTKYKERPYVTNNGGPFAMGASPRK